MELHAQPALAAVCRGRQTPQISHWKKRSLLAAARSSSTRGSSSTMNYTAVDYFTGALNFTDDDLPLLGRIWYAWKIFNELERKEAAGGSKTTHAIQQGQVAIQGNHNIVWGWSGVDVLTWLLVALAAAVLVVAAARCFAKKRGGNSSHGGNKGFRCKTAVYYYMVPSARVWNGDEDEDSGGPGGRDQAPPNLDQPSPRRMEEQT